MIEYINTNAGISCTLQTVGICPVTDDAADLIVFIRVIEQRLQIAAVARDQHNNPASGMCCRP
jgi:hypothetical protein